MKKLLLTLLLPLSIISSASYGEEINSLFGITLYKNAEEYFSSDYINLNQYKYTETNDDFYYLDITDKIKTKSPYATEYKIIIDNTNKIHRVLGYSDFINLDICQAVRKDVLSKVEDKYETNFRFIERNYPKFSIYLNSNIDSAGNEYRIQCRLWNEDSSSALQILLDSEVLANSIYDFFNSGL